MLPSRVGRAQTWVLVTVGRVGTGPEYLSEVRGETFKACATLQRPMSGLVKYR